MNNTPLVETTITIKLCQNLKKYNSSIFYKIEMWRTWKAGPASAEFITLQHAIKEKRNNRLIMITGGGSSTKVSKFLTHGGDSSTFFFSLVFKLIFVRFLLLKLDINNFSNAASIDSKLVSWTAYWLNKKLRALQTSSSEASVVIPRRL